MSTSEKLKALEERRRISLGLIGEGEWTPQDQLLASIPLSQFRTLVEAAENVHRGYICPQDPMDVDERLDRLAAALVTLEEVLP